MVESQLVDEEKKVEIKVRDIDSIIDEVHQTLDKALGMYPEKTKVIFTRERGFNTFI